MKVSRCCVEMTPPSFTAIQEVRLQTDCWLLPWECNQTFYTCISMAGYTYGACMREAYKCMCDCIDQKSYSELPYKLPTLPLLINPPPLHPPGNPEYWYSRLQPAVSLWMRPFDLYFLHVQYNFKQLPPCESCCPELTGTFNFTSFVLEYIYF